MNYLADDKESLLSKFDAFLHDLANPLTLVQISLDDLQHKAGMISDNEIRKLLNNAMDGILQVSKMIINIKQPETHCQSISVVEQIYYLTQLFQAKLDLLQINLQTEFNTDLMIDVDQVIFTRVISNLLNNAIESFDLAKNFTRFIIIRTQKSANFFKISIEDNGCGIEKSLLKSIYDKGFSTKSALRGQGLHNCLHFVQTYLKGKLKCKSRLGVGSIFTIFLPISH